MRITLAVVLVLLVTLSLPALLFAKGDVVCITIKGADLKTPIVITDPNVLMGFPVGTGPGTSSSVPGFNPNAPGFIIDWPHGPIGKPPKGLQRYEVSFYAKWPNERLIYVVFWEYDPRSRQGYVYLPGKADEWYRLNVSTIFHGVEGRWFRAWRKWDNMASPLIAGAKAADSNHWNPAR
jgi:hypothetical protein